MKYKYCNKCPECIEKDEWKDHDFFGMTPYRVLRCKLVMYNDKPRFIAEFFAGTRPTKPPDWCPQKNENL